MEQLVSTVVICSHFCNFVPYITAYDKLEREMNEL